MSLSSFLCLCIIARSLTVDPRFFAKISHVFPPAAIRENANVDQLKTANHPIASTSAAQIGPSSTGVVDYSSVTHKIGMDLSFDTAEARVEDDPDEYLYTIQLMDEDHKFEGSYMEVKAKVMRFVPTPLLTSAIFVY